MPDLRPPPDKLNLQGDKVSIALRWESWKRCLKEYLHATEIRDPEKKRDTMLILGGSQLREVIHKLPGAIVSPSEEGVNVFDTTVKKLDQYFWSNGSKHYERFIFRQIKQEEGEKFVKFVLKLRNQAEKCKFKDTAERIIDQIFEKCSSSELRRKILTLGDDVTLNKIIIEANKLEAVGNQRG